MNEHAVVLGIDCGGTHTDAVVCAGRHLLASAKVVTDHDNLPGCIAKVLQELVQETDRDILQKVERITLGTTLLVNACVQGRLDRVGLALSAGPGLAPDRFALGQDVCIVPGGLDHRGVEVTPLETGVLQKQVRAWQEEGVQAFACVGKFSPRNPAHEERMGAVVTDLCAQPALTLGQWADSHDLVAAINASMYLPDGVTSTGYMRQDDYINNKRLVRRFGAFFVAGPRQEGLPRADILTREDPQWQELLEQYRLVIQNYRMINDERRILWSPGGPLYAISAVAEDGAGKILFLHCREPLEAYSFAHALLHLPLDVRTVMYVEGGMQAGLVIRSPGLHQELRGRHLADFWVTGNVRAQLPNVLGIRRRHAPALPDCPTMLQQTAIPAAAAE